MSADTDLDAFGRYRTARSPVSPPQYLTDPGIVSVD